MKWSHLNLHSAAILRHLLFSRRAFIVGSVCRTFFSPHTHTNPLTFSSLSFSKHSNRLSIAAERLFSLLRYSLYYILLSKMALTSHFLSFFLLTVISLTVHVSAFGTPLDKLPQLQAQAACAAIEAYKPGWRSAIPRECTRYSYETCDTICKNLPLHAPDDQRKYAKHHECLNSFHVYNQDFSKKYSAAGLKTFNHNSCGASVCGPNFCCCISY